jgi:homogentisate phytyltransferase/homogentisate geranylgeranyltransferase
MERHSYLYKNLSKMQMQLKTLWQFSRPHTIIGSICSITALYCIALEGSSFIQYILLYIQTLFAALTCNIFIVGLNQIVDVKIDAINKPYLPIPAKRLTEREAYVIVFIALGLSLLVSFITSIFLFFLIIGIQLIGIAYSVPPLQLKKHHLPAAIAISVVRGILVNIGMYYHFNSSVHNQQMIPQHIWLLTIFITAFSIAIAWFKDLPDTDGDREFKIKTLAILYTKKSALIYGNVLVIFAYCLLLFWGYKYLHPYSPFFIAAHWLLLLLFIINAFTIKIESQISIKRFYMRFWIFFFAEYITYIVWTYIK